MTPQTPHRLSILGGEQETNPQAAPAAAGLVEVDAQHATVRVEVDAIGKAADRIAPGFTRPIPDVDLDGLAKGQLDRTKVPRQPARRRAAQVAENSRAVPAC